MPGLQKIFYSYSVAILFVYVHACVYPYGVFALRMVTYKVILHILFSVFSVTCVYVYLILNAKC